MADKTIALPVLGVGEIGDISGTVTTAGLSIAGRITVVALNAVTWTALPATPLAARNAITIQNESGIQIKLNYVTPGAYEGVSINDGGERFYNITDSIILYAKSASGTPSVTVEELS
jgi:hypothetical protein